MKSVLASTFGMISCLLIMASTALAGGGEFSLRGHDLEINVDTRWAGCSDGGYYPVRFGVANRGPARQFTFEVVGNSNSKVVPTRKTITIDQNAKIESVLLVPMVMDGSYATFNVRYNGRVLENMSKSVSVPEYSQELAFSPAMLVISSRNIDIKSYERGASLYQIKQLNHAVYGSTANVQLIEPNLLPDNWLAYSGLDLVAISIKDLQILNDEPRKAILKWTQTGGNLIVFDVGLPAVESTDLNRLLDLDKKAAVSKEWIASNPGARRIVLPPRQDQYGNTIEYNDSGEAEDYTSPEHADHGAVSKDGNRQRNKRVEFQWKRDEFSIKKDMLGHLVAFQGNPFTGTPSEWVWLFNTLGVEQVSWRNRTGIKARESNNSFAYFFIPGVQSVPVIPFLLLITLFAIVIGPVNYIYFKRKRLLGALLISVPVLAFGTTILLVGYSVVAHGFGVKSRVRSVTILDQKSNTAVSMTRQALYAGMTLSSGMKYSPDTLVMPIWPPQHSGDAGSVDWSETQSLQNGWLRSRTRTQFLTVGNRTERGRMKFEADGKNKVVASNGLEWAIEHVVYIDDNGRMFYGNKIPAGETASLSEITTNQKATFREGLDAYPLELPKGMTENDLEYGMFNSRRYRYSPYGYYNQTPVNYSNNLVERQLRDWKDAFTAGVKNSDASAFQKNSYFAIMKENPGISVGVSGAREQASRHFLLGYF